LDSSSSSLCLLESILNTTPTHSECIGFPSPLFLSSVLPYFVLIFWF
jgi:hypothetical protein